MKTQPLIVALLALLVSGHIAIAQDNDTGGRQRWKVGDAVREGIVILPNKDEKDEKEGKDAGRPLVFGFHGHGGSAARAQKMFALHQHWPQAIVVYLQGIEGVTSVRDPKGAKTGWQKSPGDLEDRDIKFFDAVLKDLKAKHKVDEKRIYVMGHSNGSRFVNLLWATHEETFAAVALSGSLARGLLEGSKPLPVFAIAGEKDPIVPFADQVKSLDAIRKLLGTDAEKAKGEGIAKLEAGKDGLELGTFLHPGGHEWPSRASELIVKFFQRHTRKPQGTP
ncbi:MAG: PHB depolymerase family esterase [Phycisphaeraceae bacterium]